MKSEGANRLTLEVAVDNGAARAFYGCMGFYRTEESPSTIPASWTQRSWRRRFRSGLIFQGPR